MIRSEKFFKVISKLMLTFIVSGVLFQCSDEQLLTADETNALDNAEANATTTAAASTGCSTCTYIVPAGKLTIDGKVLGIKPGAVICLDAAVKYGYLSFNNVIGTAAKPITIRNCGGTVNINANGKPYGIRLHNTKHFRLTGGDTKGSYGIRVTNAHSGIVAGYLATNFEIDHIEVYTVRFAGIIAKTDPNCDDATIRGNFTMRHIKIHDNFVRDTGGEGLYIGHTSFDGYKTACGVRLPHVIEHAKIYNNRVLRSGWDGIQLSCATKGAEVYGNTVEDYSVLGRYGQMSGILIGGGSGGLCYNNYINKGKGPGIMLFGLGDNIVHDNVVVGAGSFGMFCDERNTPGPGFKFLNNTIINPKEEGIRIYSNKVPMNVFVNNIIVNPGSYSKHKEASYVMMIKGTRVDMANNIFTRNIQDLKFANAAGANYKLLSSSPAVNKGRNISSYNIPVDFYNESRLKGSAFDIGASEY